jgi:hypothetical protein
MVLVAAFLTPEWLEHLSAAAAAAGDEVGQATAEVELTVEQVVTGGPDGDVRWRVRLDRGRLAAGPSRPGDPPADVVLVEDYETAMAVHQGEVAPSAAMAAGRLRVGGRVGLLAEHRQVLALVARRLAAGGSDGAGGR